MDFLHIIAKERNRFTEKCKVKVTQNTHFLTNVSVAKYVNLKIAKLMCCKKFHVIS